MTVRAGTNARRPPSGSISLGRAAVRELALIAALVIAYRLGRLTTAGEAGDALHHAEQVWDVERWLRLPSEAAVQRHLLDFPSLVPAATGYYAYVHFPATALCLVWLFLFHRGIYRRTRNALTALTGAALVIHVLYPLAPPRMLATAGMVDASARYGPVVYGDPATDTLSNQYAAMPSLHAGWALAVAFALIGANRTPWRWLWALHPLMTLLVVVATAHHYWLDAVVAITLYLVAYRHLRPPPETVRPGPHLGAPSQRRGFDVSYRARVRTVDDDSGGCAQTLP